MRERGIGREEKHKASRELEGRSRRHQVEPTLPATPQSHPNASQIQPTPPLLPLFSFQNTNSKVFPAVVTCVHCVENCKLVPSGILPEHCQSHVL